MLANSGPGNHQLSSELIFGADMVCTATQGPGAGYTSRVLTPDGDIAEDEHRECDGQLYRDRAFDFQRSVGDAGGYFQGSWTIGPALNEFVLR